VGGGEILKVFLNIIIHQGGRVGKFWSAAKGWLVSQSDARQMAGLVPGGLVGIAGEMASPRIGSCVCLDWATIAFASFGTSSQR